MLRKLHSWVPLPAKVLLSYLLVVAVGALPHLIYLKGIFEDRLIADTATQEAERLQRLVRHLASLSVDARLVAIRDFADIAPERITYIAGDGQVLFDSDISAIETMDSHAQRPEVLAALGALLDTDRPRFDPRLPALGVARRVSRSSNIETVYVAARLPSQEGELPHVLRFAVPMEMIRSLSERLLAVFRNSQAAAISVALLLSMVAAVMFMRPLRRIAIATNEMAEGDWTGSNQVHNDDEIGQIGRSLDRLAAELRKRFAVAQASEGMLGQLIEVIDIPLALFGPDREHIAVNPPARRLLRSGQGDATDVESFACSAAYDAALASSESSSEPASISYTGHDGRQITGWVYALRRPAAASFGLFMAPQGHATLSSDLPDESDVTPIKLGTFVAGAQAHVSRSLSTALPPITLDDGLDQTLIADADGRLELALSTLLENAWRHKEHEEPRLEAKRTPIAVVATLHGSISEQVVDLVRPHVESLGGQLEPRAGAVELTCPRA